MLRLIFLLAVAACLLAAVFLTWSSGTGAANTTQVDSTFGASPTLDATGDTPNAARRTSSSVVQAVSNVDNTTTATSDRERIAQYGYFEPLLAVEDEAVFLQSDPVTRILSPTSVQDAQWMAMHAYPRRLDIEKGDLNAMLAEMQSLHPIQQADRFEYLNNVVMAKFYRANDARWRDHASQGLGSFGVMLKLADFRDQMESGVKPDKRELIHALASAHILGEIDAMNLFEGYGGLYRVDGIELAQALRARSRELHYLNERATLRGQKPWDFSPRPPAPWNDAYPRK